MLDRNRMVRLVGLLVAVAALLPGAPPAAAPAPPPLSAGELLAQTVDAVTVTVGRVNVPGLEKPVTVLRDTWGIPHIYAETQPDLFFAQGYVAAQDRLWQLELWRRAATGTLAEILGPAAIERDRFARLLRYRGDLDAEYKSYAPDTREILTAFVRGINFFISSHRRWLPIEFRMTGVVPGPWTPEVCLSRLAGFDMTRNAALEVLRAQLAKEGGAELVDQLIETDPPRRLELPQGLDLDGIDERVLAGITASGAPLSFEQREGGNNWVVDGTRSATGRPLLASDPHRAITLPSLRYLVHLVGPGWNVIGAGEPALPGVAVGHNERIGFGLTTSGIDQQDLYVEETRPGAPDEVRTKDGWVPMQVEHERIAVKGRALPVEVDLKLTAHGPVIYEDPGRHRAYALRWVGSEPGTAGYLAALSLDRASNWQELEKALGRWKVPSENLVYADVDGNIGWQVAGLTPIRRGWSGLMPVPGAQGQYEWQGFLPPGELPHSYRPATHFIATADHDVLPPDYPHELGYEWAPKSRFERLREVLSGNARFTVFDFERLQHDELSRPACEMTRLLKGVKGVPPELARFVAMLGSWDCRVTKESAAAALYETWVHSLPARIFKPRLSEKAWALAAPAITPGKSREVLKTPTARWFGDEPIAGRDAALLAALADAVAQLQKRLGPDPKSWRYGTLNATSFTHPLATDEASRNLFNLATVERGGDGDTLKVSSPGFGASFREILDLFNWDRSVATSVPGQSGQPFAKHYGDLLPLWAQGRYFPLLFSREPINAAAKEKMMLLPE